LKIPTLAYKRTDKPNCHNSDQIKHSFALMLMTFVDIIDIIILV